jgi:hypothetical protein
MFGWLAARSFLPSCRHAPRALPAQRCREVSPQQLASRLPDLGCVLYLHATSAEVIRDVFPPGLLIAERALSPLLDTRWLLATSIVTDDGPREWLECVDSLGQIRARLHLLPDTDYLAWDALMNAGEIRNRAPTLSNLSPLRPDSAVAACFSVREWGGMQLLERCAPALSPLGARIAARIAQAESAMLLT